MQCPAAGMMMQVQPVPGAKGKRRQDELCEHDGSATQAQMMNTYVNIAFSFLPDENRRQRGDGLQSWRTRDVHEFTAKMREWARCGGCKDLHAEVFLRGVHALRVRSMEAS